MLQKVNAITVTSQKSHQALVAPENLFLCISKVLHVYMMNEP